MTKKIILVYLIIFNGFFTYSQFNGSVFCENFSPAATGLQTQNWDILQDKRGIVYFANTGGILEYDGTDWRKIHLNNDLPVRSLSSDNYGRIYVGGVGDFGYLEHKKDGTTNYNSIASTLDTPFVDNPIVWETVVINNEVFFQTREYIYYLKPYANPDSTADLSFRNAENIKKFNLGTRISTLSKIHNQCIASADKLYKFENNKFIELPFTEEFINDETVYGIFPYDNKNIIVAFENRMIKYNLNASSEDSAYTIFKTDADDYLSTHYIYSTEILPDNRIAIGTVSGGIVIINKNGEVLDIFTTDNVLQDNSVWSMLYSENILWCGLNNGISKIEINSPFRFWDKKNNIESIISIFKTDNLIYLSTFSGLYSIDIDLLNSLNPLPKFTKIQNFNNEIWNFSSVKVEGKDILLASASYGVYEIADQQLNKISSKTSYTICNSKINNNIIFSGSDNSIEALEYKNGNWNVTEIPDLDGIILSIVETDEGNLWVSTYYNYVFYIKKNSTDNFDFSSPDNYEIIHYDTLNGLPKTNHITSYMFNNEVIFGTYNGILKFDEANQYFYSSNIFSTFFGDQQQGIIDITYDPNGDIWCDGYYVLRQNNDKTYTLDSNFFKRMRENNIFCTSNYDSTCIVSPRC